MRWVPAQKEDRKADCRAGTIAANLKISDRPRRRTFTAPEATHSQRGRPSRRHRRKSVRSCAVMGSIVGFGRVARGGGGNPAGGLTPARRGPKSRPVNPLATELASARKTPSSGAVWSGPRPIIEVQKNLPIWTGIQLAPIAPEIVRDNTP